MRLSTPEFGISSCLICLAQSKPQSLLPGVLFPKKVEKPTILGRQNLPESSFSLDLVLGLLSSHLVCVCVSVSSAAWGGRGAQSAPCCPQHSPGCFLPSARSPQRPPSPEHSEPAVLLSSQRHRSFMSGTAGPRTRPKFLSPQPLGAQCTVPLTLPSV